MDESCKKEESALMAGMQSVGQICAEKMGNDVLLVVVTGCLLRVLSGIVHASRHNSTNVEDLPIFQEPRLVGKAV